MIQRVPAGEDYGRPARPDAPAIDWQAHQRDTLIRGRRVRYVEIGEGEPGFVCVHGLGGCWAHWTETLPMLAEHGRAIALDLPGFGGSRLPQDPITLDLFADTAAELAQSAGLERVTLIGHSMGGPIALRFAARHPQLTHSLILVAGAVKTFSTLLGPREAIPTARAHPRSAIATYTEALTCGVPLPGSARRAIARHKPLRSAALWPYVRRPSDLRPETVVVILKGAGAPGALPTARAIGRSDPYRGLAEIDCPILSIGATHDHIAPVADLEAFDRIAPTATSVLLDDAGHMMMLERPGAFNEQVESFVTSQSAAATPQT